LHDHAVERTGQLPDFVNGRHIDGLIQLTRLDRAKSPPAIAGPSE
jgi:hypothetical protein